MWLAAFCAALLLGGTLLFAVPVAADTPALTPVTVTIYANGTPVENGDSGSGTGWTFDGDALTLSAGYGFTFTGDTCKVRVTNNGTILDGEFSATVSCNGTLAGGKFGLVTLMPTGRITGGEYNDKISNKFGSSISGGIFNKEICSSDDDPQFGCTITGGTFYTSIQGNQFNISGGTFYGSVDIKTPANNQLSSITGGEFYEKVLIIDSCIADGNGTAPVFHGNITCSEGTIQGGTFTKTSTVFMHGGTISGGTFAGPILLSDSYIGYGKIAGGLFNGEDAVITTQANCTIENGTFCGTGMSIANSGNITGGRFACPISGTGTIGDDVLFKLTVNGGSITGGADSDGYVKAGATASIATTYGGIWIAPAGVFAQPSAAKTDFTMPKEKITVTRSCGLTVGGAEVTPMNAGNVTGGGIDSGTVSFDPAYYCN